jgi:hypothetical protein
MTRTEKVLLPWKCTLGNKSDINLAGKIVLFPIIVIFAGTISLLELLFSKDDEGADV